MGRSLVPAQLASDSGNAAALVFFLFDLLYVATARTSAPDPSPYARNVSRVCWRTPIDPCIYSDHQSGHGRAFHEQACKASLEGTVWKRADAAYAPGNRGLWRKVKCLYRQGFVVVGWTAAR